MTSAFDQPGRVVRIRPPHEIAADDVLALLEKVRSDAPGERFWLGVESMRVEEGHVVAHARGVGSSLCCCAPVAPRSPATSTTRGWPRSPRRATAAPEPRSYDHRPMVGGTAPVRELRGQRTASSGAPMRRRTALLLSALVLAGGAAAVTPGVASAASSRSHSVRVADDHGGRSHAERGDDRGGKAHVERGDDRGGRGHGGDDGPNHR